VAGYEMWGALIEREPGKFLDRGFHPTAIHGTLAAAAACAWLNRLDNDRTGHAIAIAASLSSGLAANFGTMTKSLHVGRAAQAGIISARLARRGFTGSLDALEHRTGYLQAHSPSGKPDVSKSLELGQRWRIESAGLNIKRYPICYATHRSIDAMINLAKGRGLVPDSVSEIRVKIGETQRLMLRNHAPKNALEAKFSIEFALASALIARGVGLAQLTDSFVRSPEIVGAMRKVKCSTTSEVMPDLPLAPADHVDVKLASGEIISHEPVAFARGSVVNPMSDEEFKGKFMECVGTAVGDNRAASLHSTLTSLWEANSLRDLPFGY
jgi:2-methylcitrate dehydratase PrpD